MKTKLGRILVGLFATWMALFVVACKSPSTLASGTQSQTDTNSTAPAVTAPTNLQPVVYDDRVVRTVPATRVVHRTVYASPYSFQPVVVRRHRTWQQSAVIIGASSGTGALIGAVAKGKRGALVGGLAGGAAGFIYDQLTRNK